MPASSDQLHTHFVEAEKHLEQGATGMAGVPGMPEDAVKVVTQMAAMCRKIATGLAKTMRDEPAPEQRPTIDSATDEMMAERAAPPE